MHEERNGRPGRRYDDMTQQNQSPVVTDEMVEFAAQTYEAAEHDEGFCSRIGMRAALEAALPSGVRVRVKPLQWVGLTSAREDGPPEPTGDIEAETLMGEYSICVDEAAIKDGGPDWKWCVWSPIENLGHFGDLDEAKAAAQADYESRIRAAIDPTPSPSHAETVAPCVEAPAPDDLEVVAWLSVRGYVYVLQHEEPMSIEGRTIEPLVRLTDAQAAIAAKDGEIERLTQDREWWKNAAQDALDERKAAEARVAQLEGAARVFEDHYERSICHHEETHRVGSIWTICNQCGSEWADDRGGFKPFEYPSDIIEARAALHPEKEGE